MGIPIVIHLSQRRKFKEFHVGTLRFLQLAEKKRNLRLRVEEWPLLLLRMLALALLAFLFARPFLSDREQTEAAQEKTILLLDASGSMTAGMADEARAAAKKAIKEAGAVTVGQFSDAVQVIGSIDDYQPVAGAPSDFNKALGWTLDHLRSEGVENARVIMVGHFAAAAMPSSPPRVWPPRVHVEVIAVQPPEFRNEAVRATELLTPFATGQMEIEARVTPSEKDRELSLAAEGINLKQTVPAGAERAIFSFRPPREEVRGFISLEGKDAWPADDRRPFAYQWAEPEKVVILDGFPGATPFEGQGYFLEKALAASGAAHGMSPFRPEISFGIEGQRQEEGASSLFGVIGEALSGNMLDSKKLEKVSAIAICGPTVITAREAKMIRTAVDKGAGLLIAIDSRWTPEATAALRGEGLFPEAVEFTGGMQQRRLSSWDKKHPALEKFDGKEGGDLRQLLWRDAFSMEADENWEALATLEGGHPLLVELKQSNARHGRVMVLAHPLTREWGDLPREPLFVPLAKNFFNVLARYEARPHSANVTTPGINEARAIGYYQAADGSAEMVAAAPAESAVMAVDAAGFRKAFALPEIPSQPQATTAADPALAGLERPRSGEWWPWLVLGLLLLLTIECAVATRRAARLEPATPADA